MIDASLLDLKYLKFSFCWFWFTFFFLKSYECSDNYIIILLLNDNLFWSTDISIQLSLSSTTEKKVRVSFDDRFKIIHFKNIFFKNVCKCYHHAKSITFQMHSAKDENSLIE